MSPPARINLEQSTVLLVGDNQQALDVLSSIVSGFGVGHLIKCNSAADAIDSIRRRPVDLILVESAMAEMDGFDFIRWLRRQKAPVCVTPAVLLMGHASRSAVEKSRDCGASFVIAKPLTPAVLIQRLIWLGRDERAFVESPNYVGPDRRIRNFGPPPGMGGRREGDLSAEVSSLAGENLDQADIDMLMKPQRVSL